MVRQVEFHTGVAEPVGFCCRLVRKAYRKGVGVVLVGDDEVLRSLDRALWTFDERDFVPHAWVDGPPPDDQRRAQLARTPIWLWRGGDLPAAHPSVLVNLGVDTLSLADSFDRVIELVSAEPDAAAAGRRRWRAWQAAGHEVTHHPVLADRE